MQLASWQLPVILASKSSPGKTVHTQEKHRLQGKLAHRQGQTPGCTPHSFMSRQSTENTEAVPVRATSLIRIPTLAARIKSASLGMQDKGVSLQVPSDLAFARMEQLGSASDLSESVQYTLQDLGWSLGRRGLEPSSASTVRSSPSQFSSSTVLKDFWGHFTGLSWLPLQKQLREQNPLIPHEKVPLAQHEHAQHTKHEVFKFAQQVLHRAVTDTSYFQGRRHIDGMNAKSAGSRQQHEPSAGHPESGHLGSGELLHFKSIRDAVGGDRPLPVPPQHAQGGDARMTNPVSPIGRLAVMTAQCTCVRNLTMTAALEAHEVQTPRCWVSGCSFILKILL